MKMSVTLPLCVLLASCSQSQRPFTACTKDQREKVAEFVKSSIESANNKSDEEMEDVINQLEITGRNCFCGKQMMYTVFGGTIDYETSNVVDGVSYYY